MQITKLSPSFQAPPTHQPKTGLDKLKCQVIPTILMALASPALAHGGYKLDLKGELRIDFGPIRTA